MSFLTPLYLLGLAAVSLPLIFHLIRRTPKGQYNFSSLMFLAPSPPRLTRRSRIDNLLLLLLRATALVLLAAAFARPFLRSVAQLGLPDHTGRKVAILVDTSASMQRAGVWEQTRAKVNEILDDLGPGDDVALYRFGAGHDLVVGFDEVAADEPALKISRIREAFDAVTPGWSSSQLGEALVSVADEVDQLGVAGGADRKTIRRVVLISDLQEGVQLQGLRSYEWPDDVELVVHAVGAVEPTNAGLHLAAASGTPQSEEIRVRVENSGDSARDQFTLQWQVENGRAVGGEPVHVYVPAGESRVVRAPLPTTEAGADRLVLSGDDHEFDNTLYRVSPEQGQLQLLYVGSDERDNPAGLRYYLERAFPESSERRVDVVARKPEASLDAEELAASAMVVATASLPNDTVTALQDYVQAGGALLIVLQDRAQGPTVGRLLGVEDLALEEVKPDDYAMFGQIDFSVPLFAPFADPRYSDFTKVHFWKYRKLNLPDEWDGKILARFDTRDPMLVERAIGRGRLWVLATGWHPDDSHLARSTKFVPLLSGMLESSRGKASLLAQYEVSDPVELPFDDASGVAGSVRMPDGSVRKLASDAIRFDETSQPGIYSLSLGDREHRFAVNVPALESKTARMPTDELGERGATIARPPTRAETAESLRQMRDVELEGRQKLWRWLIVAALAVLILETWLAGRLARLSMAPSANSANS